MESDKYSSLSHKPEFPTNPTSTNPSITQIMNEDTQLIIPEDEENKGCCTNGIFKNKKTRLYIIAGIIGIIIFSILLIFFVIIPSKVQSYANATEIQMNYIDLISVKDQSLNLDINFQITQSLPASAKSDATNAIVKYNGKPFGTVDIPSMEFEGGNTETNHSVASTTLITNKNVFTEMGIALVKQNKVLLEIEASIPTHAMGFLSYNVDFIREMEVTTLEQFQNPPPVVNSIYLKSCTPSYYIMIINATLDNTSQIGLNGIGELNLSVYYGDTVRADKYVGTTVPLNPSLGFPRGLNTYEFEVTMPNSFFKIPLLLEMFQGLTSNTARFQLTGTPPGAQASKATDIELLQPMIQVVQIDVMYKGGIGEFTTGSDCNILSILGGG